MALYVATNNGVAIAQAVDGEWRLEKRTLEGREVTSIIAREGVILAGTRQGVFRSDDAGETWQAASDGLEVLFVRWLAYHPQLSDYEYAGTEPAAIFYSVDGARSWQACPEVEGMRDRFGWSLPYSPEAGCVRGFAFHGSRAYAAVEDGAVLYSDDIGANWQLAPGSAGKRLHNPAEGQIHSDVHSIEVHPDSGDLVMAPTGGGLFASRDGGNHWNRLYRCYCRAAWMDPEDPDHLVFGPADGVDRMGRLEESHDGGKSWQTIHEGLSAPWPRYMVERLIASGTTLFAVLSNGELLAADINVWHWQQINLDGGRINDVTMMGK